MNLQKLYTDQVSPIKFFDVLKPRHKEILHTSGEYSAQTWIKFLSNLEVWFSINIFTKESHFVFTTPQGEYETSNLQQECEELYWYLLSLSNVNLYV